MRMRQSVKMLFVFLILLSISGCTQKIVIPQECDVPIPDEPIPVQLISQDPLSHAKNIGRNYMKMKIYAKKLRDALQVCTNR